MHAFEEDGVIVFPEPFQQRTALPGTHDKRQKARLVDEVSTAFVIIYLVAVIGKFGLRLPLSVLITV
jgi:hypothetical protein